MVYLPYAGTGEVRGNSSGRATPGLRVNWLWRNRAEDARDGPVYVSGHRGAAPAPDRYIRGEFVSAGPPPDFALTLSTLV